MTFGGTQVATGLAFLLALACIALIGHVARLRSRLRRAIERGRLSDGIVLVIEDSVVVDASPEAGNLLGDAAGSSPSGRNADQLLATFLGSQGAAGIAAGLSELRQNGTAFARTVRRADGTAVTVAGRPRGAQIQLVLRQAGPPEVPDGAADPAPLDDGPGADAPDPALAGVGALLERAPVIFWCRDGAGRIVWSRGRVANRHGSVEARTAAAAAGSERRTAQSGEAADRDDATPRSRHLRMQFPGDVPGASIALDAVEVPGPDGTSFGLAVDATALHGAEQNLARFVRTMTETFAHLTVGLAIFDRDQALAMFNPALAQMWQLEPAWLAHRPTLREIIDRLRANRRIPETADFHRWRSALTGLFDNTDTAHYEELWHLADGSDIRVFARPHPHGSLAFMFDDVTERLRLEQQFRRSIDLRRATLDRLDEGLAVFGHDGLLQFVNTAFHAIWGTDSASVRQAVHARELLPLLSALTVETDVWPRMRAFITSDDIRQTWTARLTLGSGRIVRARFAPLPDGSTLVTFTDVTDTERFSRALHERNEVLEAAEEMRSAVLEQISHRLRTPLNTIFGFSQMIADPNFGPLSESQRSYAESILEAARQLLANVDEVTDLAVIEIDPAYEEDLGLPLGETLMQTGRLLERRAAEAGVSLHVATPGPDCDPVCDSRRLRQIVFRLATAAISRCSPGRMVELGARNDGPAWIIIFANVLPGGTGDGLTAKPAVPLADSLLPALAKQEGGSFDLAMQPGSGMLLTVRLANRIHDAGDPGDDPPVELRATGPGR